MSTLHLAVVTLVLLVFGVLGFQRGWLRELVTLGVLLLGWLILSVLGAELVSLTNRVWLIAQFVVEGGADVADANALLRRLRASPLVDPREPELFFGLLYLLVAIAGYLGAQRLGPRPHVMTTQILGTFAGALNGYVLTYVLLRYASAEARLSLTFNVSTGGVADTLGQHLTTLLLVGVASVIGIALLSTIRLRASGSGRRAKGSG